MPGARQVGAQVAVRLTRVAANPSGYEPIRPLIDLDQATAKTIVAEDYPAESHVRAFLSICRVDISGSRPTGCPDLHVVQLLPRHLPPLE